MCKVQAKYFTKAGTAEWGNCSLQLTDIVGVEAVVTFSGSELGKRYHISYGIKFPNGFLYFANSENQTVYGTETFNLQLPAPGTPPLVSGNYTLVNVEVREEGTNTLVCYG